MDVAIQISNVDDLAIEYYKKKSRTQNFIAILLLIFLM